jgi:phage baseplate assembly protein V
VIQELTERVERLEKTLNQIVRVGLVVAVFPDKGTVRVTLPDRDGVVTQELPVMVRKAQEDKFYALPDIDEQVLCVFLPYGLEQGFVLGAMYSKQDTVPVSSKDKCHMSFKDGTYLEYDRDTHLLTADVKGNVNVVATGVATVQAPQINLIGNISAVNSGGGAQSVIDTPNFETKGGAVKLASQGTVQKIVTADFLDSVYDLHTHYCPTCGNNTNVPNQLANGGKRTSNVEAS